MGESICVHGGGRASTGIDFAGGEKRPSIISYVLETPEHHGPTAQWIERTSANLKVPGSKMEKHLSYALPDSILEIRFSQIHHKNVFWPFPRE